MTEQTDDELYAQLTGARAPEPLSTEDQELWDAVYDGKPKALADEDQTLYDQLYPNH